jgi:hypothetical protein
MLVMKDSFHDPKIIFHCRILVYLFGKGLRPINLNQSHDDDDDDEFLFDLIISGI